DGWRNNAEVARGTSRSPEIWPGRRIGVMVGREAYQNPGILAAVDREIFGSSDTDADPVAVVIRVLWVNKLPEQHVARHLSRSKNSRKVS
ncbi:tRNA-dihydrouridine synthase, partial [Escherichia coli]|nr:tRNA-dihydrouridine synthase [Escherichia coli]